MSVLLALLAFQTSGIESCDHVVDCWMLELNHVVKRRSDFWGGNPKLHIDSYWLGRRAPDESDLGWVVDWWEEYREETVWQGDGFYYVMIYTAYGLFLIRAKHFKITTTSYDIEAEQRKGIIRRWGLKAEQYRRGLKGRVRRFSYTVSLKPRC